jgi:hypothetical protein
MELTFKQASMSTIAQFVIHMCLQAQSTAVHAIDACLDLIITADTSTTALASRIIMNFSNY